MPSTRFALREPSSGQTTLHARNVAQWAELRAAERERFCARVAAAAKRPVEQVREDVVRGRFLGADEAVDYGLIDEVCLPDAAIHQLARFRFAHGIPAAALTAGRAAPPLPTMRVMAAAATPRIAPLPREAWDDVLTRVLEGSSGGTEEPMHIFTTLARAPGDLFRRWLGFGGALLGGTLPARLRELVILRTACRFDGRYEWAQHIDAGRAGRRLRAKRWPPWAGTWGRRTGPPWSGLPSTRSTRRPTQGAVTDATWATLAASLHEGELIELLMLIAHYLMLTTVLRSLRASSSSPGPRPLARRVATGPAASGGQ